MDWDFSVSDIIAFLALLLSVYATWTTSRFNRQQRSLIESQEKLNRIHLEKEKNETLGYKKANLDARIIKLGRNYRLKIWNSGKAIAHRVKLDFPEGNDFVIQSEIDEKFPLESLGTHQSVQLISDFAMGKKSKQCIRLRWYDEFSRKNEKTVYVTF